MCWFRRGATPAGGSAWGVIGDEGPDNEALSLYRRPTTVREGLIFLVTGKVHWLSGVGVGDGEDGE